MQYKHTKYIIAATFIILLNITINASDAAKTAALIAPLVNDSTVVVVHADLQNLGLHEVCVGLVDRLDQNLANYGFDESSVKGIKKELQNVIFKGEASIQKYLDILTKKSGVGDAFFLIELKEGDDINDLRGILFLAFPTASRTAEMKKNLEGLFESAIENEDVMPPFEHAGFQIMVMQPETDSERIELDEVKEIFKERKPVASSALAEAFAKTESDTVQAVLLISPRNCDFFISAMKEAAKQNTEQLANTGNEETMKLFNSLFENAIKNLEYFKGKMDWAAYGFNIKTMTVSTTLRLKDEKTAVEALKFIEATIDKFSKMIDVSLSTDDDIKPFAPLCSELIRGYYRSVLPKVVGNELVYSMEYQRIDDTLLPIYISSAYFGLPDPDEE